MVVARGIMIMDRINVRPTFMQFFSFSPPSPATCSGSPSPVTITVRVFASGQAGLPNVHPTGSVSIFDTNLGFIATQSLVAAIPTNASDATFVNVTLGSTTNNLYAVYNGVVNQFGPAQTSVFQYLISLTGSALSFTTPATSTINTCYSNTIPLTVLVQSGGSPVTSGTVIFRLYNTEGSFIALGSSSLNGSGNASKTIPINTVTPGETWGVQAIFTGQACISQTASPPGISNSALQVNSISLDPTNVGEAFPTSGGATFCIRHSKQFSVNITATDLPSPTIGTITLHGHKGATNIVLGSNTANGASPTVITVPASTFTSTGSWTITTSYAGDGICYANDTNSNALSVSLTEDSTSTTINSVTPSTFSRTAGGNVAVSVTVTSGVAGSIDGTIDYYCSLTLIFTDNVVGGSVSSNIPKINFPAGASQTFTAIFNGDGAGSDCYGSSSDSQTITVNA